MKKVLFSLFLALTCLPAFAQIDATPRVIKPINLVRCTPYTWNITGETYDHDTTVMVTNYHPDTVYVLNLVVDPDNIVRINDTASANCVYIWRDSLVWKTTGVHTATIPDPHGCDTVFSINLTITSTFDTAMVGKVSACGKYMSPWGTLFTQDTVVDTNYITEEGCHRRDSLILKVNPEYRNLPTAHADAKCSYVWRDGNNMLIEDTLVHKYKLTTTTGECDSIISIKVNMSFRIDTTYDAVVCDQWVAPWDPQQTYTVSQVIVHSDTNIKKCVYTDTVNLTVNYSFNDTTYANSHVKDTTIGCYLMWGDTLINTVTENAVLRMLANATVNQCDSLAAVRVIGLNNTERVDTVVTPCAKPYNWRPVLALHTLDQDTICHDTLFTGSCTTYYTLDLRFSDSIVTDVRPLRCAYDSVQYGPSRNRIRYSFRINDEGDTIVKRFTGSATTPEVTDADMNSVFYYNSTSQCTTYYKLRLNIAPISDRSSYDTAVACNRYTFTRYNNLVLTHSVDTAIASDSSYVLPAAANYPTTVPDDTINSCYKQEYNLKLTILHSDTLFDVVTACDRYTWRNDTTYTTSITLSRATRDTNGVGCRTYRTLKLTINKTPEAHISGDWMLAPGGSTTLTATSPVSGLVYTWYQNGVMQPEHPETFDVSDDGSHNNIDIMMTASNGNGCPDSNFMTVTFTNIGIEEAEDVDVSIYPNPASRVVNLRTAETIASVSVYNAIGQQVMLREGNSNSMQLDLYGLANGHYTMRIVTTDGRVANRKFIVSK